MAALTIRKLDPAVTEQLRARAERNGHSMEAEARHILETTLSGATRTDTRNLIERVRAHVDPIGGIDLDLPPRGQSRPLPTFD